MFSDKLLGNHFPLFAAKNGVIRSFNVNSIPSPGYCLSTRDRISAGSFDAATFASQSAMYFFIHAIAAKSRVAPGPSWPGNNNGRLQRRNLIQRLHPFLASLVPRHSKIDVIENRIPRHHRLQRWDVNKTISRPIALDSARDRKLLALQSQHGTGKFLRQHRIRSRNIVAISRQPKFLACRPPRLRTRDRRRQRDDLSSRKRLMQHRQPKQMIRDADASHKW